MNVNPNQLKALLNVVSKKLNMSPEALQQQLEQGKFDAAINNMKPNEAATFQQALNNPKILEQMMSSPQMKALYDKLTGGK